MALKVKCSECGRDFTPTSEQMKFIKESKAKGMDLIIFDCGNCHFSTFYNPQTGRPPREKKEITYWCPVSGCSGKVSYVKDDDGPFWGCGECGSIWYDKKNLLKEIDAIVKRFKYRRKCYKKVKGKWEPADSPIEPDGYYELVADEPADGAKDYVRG